MTLPCRFNSWSVAPRQVPQGATKQVLCRTLSAPRSSPTRTSRRRDGGVNRSARAASTRRQLTAFRDQGRQAPPHGHQRHPGRGAKLPRSRIREGAGQFLDCANRGESRRTGARSRRPATKPWPVCLGLATPMAVAVATGRGARAGLFVREASAFERMDRLATFIFDKTGTLTEGKPSVVDVATVPGMGSGTASRRCGRGRVSERAPAGSSPRPLRDPPRGHRIPGGTRRRSHGQGRRPAGPGRLRAVPAGRRGRFVAAGRLCGSLEPQASTVLLVAVDGRSAVAIAVADTLKRMPVR